MRARLHTWARGLPDGLLFDDLLLACHLLDVMKDGEPPVSRVVCCRWWCGFVSARFLRKERDALLTEHLAPCQDSADDSTRERCRDVHSGRHIFLETDEVGQSYLHAEE